MSDDALVPDAVVREAIWALEKQTGERLPDADGEDHRIMRAVLAPVIAFLTDDRFLTDEARGDARLVPATDQQPERDCTCTDEGEDPKCPYHGYEAVIQALEEARDEARAERDALLEEVEKLPEGMPGFVLKHKVLDLISGRVPSPRGGRSEMLHEQEVERLSCDTVMPGEATVCVLPRGHTGPHNDKENR